MKVGYEVVRSACKQMHQSISSHRLRGWARVKRESDSEDKSGQAPTGDGGPTAGEPKNCE